MLACLVRGSFSPPRMCATFKRLFPLIIAVQILGFQGSSGHHPSAIWLGSADQSAGTSVHPVGHECAGAASSCHKCTSVLLLCSGCDFPPTS